MASSAQPVTIRAAGAVLWRSTPAGVRVAVIHRPKRGDWSLPKGKLDPGESEAEAAVREVAEETGWEGDLGAEITTIAYEVEGVPKTVRYWGMRATGGTFAPGREVDRLEWLPPDAARARLTYGHDRGVLDRFLASRACP